MTISDNGQQDAATLGELGEQATLQRIFPRLPVAELQVLGPGDDAAVLAAPDGRYVVTTDMMVHGPDFRLAWSGGHDLGWKAAASNLADVAAMGARPTGLVVALAVPVPTLVTTLLAFADGMREACEALAPGCGVVGGDLSVSNTFTIAVTAFGSLEGRQPVLRSGARVGDVVAVSGALGDAGRGLRLLFEHAVDRKGRPDARMAADLTRREPDLVGAQRRPRPPVADGAAAAAAGATAMLDLSDGLAIDARRIAAASGVGIDLETSSLGDDLAAALGGGEDHSLLACFPPQEAALPGGFRRIGTVTVGEGLLIDGVPYDQTSGWDPYRGWDGRVG